MGRRFGAAEGFRRIVTSRDSIKSRGAHHDVETAREQLQRLARRLRRRPESDPAGPARRRRRGRCITGCSARARSGSYSATREARRVSTTSSRSAVSRTSAHGSSGATCSAPCAAPWPDESWRGWWGDNPPYHCEVFVLTHHARKSFAMEGRHDVPLRHGRHRGGTESRAQSGRRQGRARRRRRRDDSAVPARALDR